MKFRTLGMSGLHVSAVGLGCMGISHAYGKPADKNEMVELLAEAVDMGNFYRVPADNRGLNYDKYFKDGDAKRNTLTEFNSNNTKLLCKEEIKAKMMELTYIRDRLSEE